MCLSFLLALYGCGSETSDQNPDLEIQPKEIEISGPTTVTVFLGELTSNPLDITEGLNVNYSSRNEMIASIDNEGNIEAVSIGKTSIIAKYGSQKYEYKIEVISNQVNFVAKIGKQNTKIVPPGNFEGLNVFSSRDRDCDFIDYAECELGFKHIFNEVPVLIDSVNLNNSGAVKVSFKNFESTSIISPKLYKGRGHQIVEFNGRLWNVENKESSINAVAEIWSSANGLDWELETNTPGFSARIGHQVIVHDSKLWLIGGRDETGSKNDVWSSSDGVSWNLIVEEAEFSKRYHHEALSFNGRIWVIGGTFNSTPDGQVWSSLDGVVWNHESNIPRRYKHRVIKYKDHIVVVGGSTGISLSSSTALNDVWASSDGINWTELTEDADFKSRFAHELFVFEGALYLLGGHDGSLGQFWKTDIWRTDDGASWSLVTEDAGFFGRTFFQSLVFDNKIWSFGGYDQDWTWFSEDAENWFQSSSETKEQFLTGRAASFRGKLWNIKRNSNEIWTSNNGLDWFIGSIIPDMSKRRHSIMLEHNDSLWLLGGYDENSGSLNDVWVSSNGDDWQKVSDNFPGFTNYYEATTHKGKIYIVLKEDTGNQFNKVYSSADGIEWVERTPQAEFSSRSFFKVTSYQGKIWLIGGDETTDIWSSEDGEIWTLEAEDPEFGNINHYVLKTFKDRLLLITDEVVWQSTDGINWTLLDSDPAYPTLVWLNVLIHDQELLFIENNRPTFWSSENGSDWRINRRVPFSFETIK